MCPKECGGSVPTGVQPKCARRSAAEVCPKECGRSVAAVKLLLHTGCYQESLLVSHTLLHTGCSHQLGVCVTKGNNLYFKFLRAGCHQEQLHSYQE